MSNEELPDIDWDKVTGLGFKPSGFAKQLKRAKRWLIANPFDFKTRQHGAHKKPPMFVQRAIWCLKRKEPNA